MFNSVLFASLQGYYDHDIDKSKSKVSYIFNSCSLSLYVSKVNEIVKNRSNYIKQNQIDALI